MWPGVEIDVLEPRSTRWHLIVVANPKEALLFSNKVDQIFQGLNLNVCTLSLDSIYGAFKDLDCIYIAHFHKKKPAIPESDSEKLDSLVGEPYRVFKETANESSMSVFANYRYNVLVGSDVKDWNQYEKCTFSELKLPVDSFEQFCLLAKRDVNVVETLLNKKSYKNLIAHPASGVNLSVRLYADMNIIFGQKGTGKTQIIKTLCEGMKASGLNCVQYIASEREDDFKSLIGSRNSTIDLEKMGADDCQEDFLLISQWKDKNPTHFKNYLDWKKTEGNNANKTRMKITRATVLVENERENEGIHKHDYSLIKGIIKSFREINISEYLSDEKEQTLIALLQELNTDISTVRRDDLIDHESVNLVNFSINSIKAIADKSTNSVSKPSTTGFSGFVESRLDLLKSVNHILSMLKTPEINEPERIGFLDEKAQR